MKIASYISLAFLASGLFLSCKKDNYSAPSSQLSGALLYKGDTVAVEYNRVPFQLYQYGFGKVGPIDGVFDQNGSYHAVVFDGDYKFIIPVGKGPFLPRVNSSGNADTLAITVKGNQKVDINVTPYYMIRNAQITGGGGTINATCKLEKIVTDGNAKNIEKVVLYYNRTQFVSGANNMGSTTISGSAITDPNNINLSVAVAPFTPAQSYVFARIGVKIVGVETMIFSPLKVINY